MKKLLVPLVLAAATALTASPPAHAFTPGGAFTLSGPLNLKFGTYVLPCTATLQVNNLSSGNGIIVAGVLTGSTLCMSLRPVDFPWFIIPDSNPGALMVTNVAIATNGATCGPATVAATWSNTSPGTMSISGAVLPVGCQIVSATLSASPAQTLP